MAHRKPDDMGTMARAREELSQVRDSIMRLEAACFTWNHSNLARAQAHQTRRQLDARLAQIQTALALRK